MRQFQIQFVRLEVRGSGYNQELICGQGLSHLCLREDNPDANTTDAIRVKIHPSAH